jgi:hypothetical protein
MSERPNEVPEGPIDETEVGSAVPAHDAAAADEASIDFAAEGDGESDGGETAAEGETEGDGENEGETENATDGGDATSPEEGTEGEWSDAEIAGAADAGRVEAAVAADLRGMRPSERRAHRARMEGSHLHVDPSMRITDRASALFVLVTVGIFAVIFLNAMVLGRGGLLTPLPTQAPIPTPAAASPAVPSPAATPAAASPAAAPSMTITPSPTPPASVAPSASPAAS